MLLMYCCTVALLLLGTTWVIGTRSSAAGGLVLGCSWSCSCSSSGLWSEPSRSVRTWCCAS
jgi:hypothetical protein